MASLLVLPSEPEREGLSPEGLVAFHIAPQINGIDLGHTLGVGVV